MKMDQVDIEKLVPYVNNARTHSPEQINKIRGSLREFGFVNPVLIDGEYNVIAGHGRIEAARMEGIKEVPCVFVEHLTATQQKAYILADNRLALDASWDDDLLRIELSTLDDLGFDLEIMGFDTDDLKSINFDGDESSGDEKKKTGSLAEDFLIPPFSVFDTRQGYWQDRKRAWMGLGIKSEVGRGNDILGNLIAVDPSYPNAGVSVFDPVLCEVSYLWFNVPGGSILDPFAGGSVRGVVAEKIGYKYTGIDLSAEQIEANNENADELGVAPVWITGDSNVVLDGMDEKFDMVFTCPPYMDLEVYSDNPGDISNMSDDGFNEVYKSIIGKAADHLKDDRFMVIVVSDVRAKKGEYKGLVHNTIQFAMDAGLVLYNEIVLINVGGTLPMRAGISFSASRKVGRQHQNVLVFYKGNTKNINKNFKEVNVAELDEAQDF